MGTRLVKDIKPGIRSSTPRHLTAVGDRLFFTAQLAETGRELWRTDGTAEGTRLVEDIGPGADNARILRLKDIDGRVWFRADDGVHGLEPWVSTGTAAGTRMVKDIHPGPHDSFDQFHSSGFGAVDGQVIIVAGDGSRGREPWISDGTTKGTRFLKDIRVGPKGSKAELFTEAGDPTFFRAHDGPHGRELWVTDGTPEGTRMVEEITPGNDSSVGRYPEGFEAVAGRLFFRDDDIVHGVEPWISDGTAAGTRMLRDIRH